MEILTTAEAAKRLGVSARRLRAMIKAGQLTAQKFGTAYMINAKDLAKVQDRKPGRPKKKTASKNK